MIVFSLQSLDSLDSIDNSRLEKRSASSILKGFRTSLNRGKQLSVGISII